MVTPSQLKTVFPSCRDPSLWVSLFQPVFDEFQITTIARQNMWVAQCGFESSSFNVLRENLSYGPDQLQKVWPRYFPDEATAQRFARRPVDLGNYVYANRLGNGDAASGDGFTYRGGGLIELTGRLNYKTIGGMLNMPLEDRPALVEQPPTGARTAGLFWHMHGLNEIADTGDIARATKVINGGEAGLDQRTALWMKLQSVVS